MNKEFKNRGPYKFYWGLLRPETALGRNLAPANLPIIGHWGGKSNLEKVPANFNKVPGTMEVRETIIELFRQVLLG